MSHLKSSMKKMISCNCNTIAKMQDLVDSFECSYTLYDAYNQGILAYINHQKIPYEIKQKLIHLVQNDNYNDYLEIYNICLENGIELPPL